MTVRFFAIALLATLSFSAGALVAHHSTERYFDLDDLVLLKGIVSDVRWANPHTYAFMNVTTCKVDNWAVELPSPNALMRAGLTRLNFNPGAAFSVLSAPARPSTPPGMTQAEPQAKANHFVLGGCITLASGETYEHREGPLCSKAAQSIREIGTYLKPASVQP